MAVHGGGPARPDAPGHPGSLSRGGGLGSPARLASARFKSLRKTARCEGGRRLRSERRRRKSAVVKPREFRLPVLFCAGGLKESLPEIVTIFDIEPLNRARIS